MRNLPIDQEARELYDEAWHVAENMQQRGGSFVRALGEALQHADVDNKRRIKEAFPDYWNEYTRG